MVIYSISVKWLHQIMAVLNAVVSYKFDFSTLYNSIMLSYYIDMAPTTYDLISYNVNVRQGNNVSCSYLEIGVHI